MFPSGITTPITIYPQYTNNETGLVTNMRCVLNGCFYVRNDTAAYRKNGIVTEAGTRLFILHNPKVTGKKYVPFAEWQELAYEDLAEYWTVNPKQSPALTIVVKGECLHEFTPSTIAELARQEQAFMHEHLPAQRIKTVCVNFYGNKRMWHLEVTL